MDNNDIAKAFSQLAKIMDIHGENSFKTKTYSNAAFQIERLEQQLETLDLPAVSAIRGIGDTTAKKIRELLETGKMSLLEKYLETTPPGVLEMMQVKGIGAKKINIIWKEMEIETLGELLYACNENRLTRYKGFGAKTEQNIREAIEFYLSKQGFFLYRSAVAFCNTIQQLLSAKFPSKQVLLTGDVRRQCEVIEDVSFVTNIPSADMKFLLDQETGFHFSVEENNVLTYRMEAGPVVKLHCTNDENLAKTLFLTTGTAEFIAAFEKKYPKSLDISFATHEENKIFESVGLQPIPACLREDESILEKAENKAIPELIIPADIKGIIHSHSTWSDGIHSLKEMALRAIANGYEYLVISDHSKSAVYANGLAAERIAAQHVEIDALNKELAPFKIFKSIESDILFDGSLDYADTILSTFDLVIASVHSGLKMTEEKATERLLKAIENPFTTILGHMTGRLLLSRSGYPIDHKKIIDACAANHVVIELNANPRRLDMDWRWLPYALSKDVLISIDPDAHSADAFAEVTYGVLSAQKGMLIAKHNLSSFSLEQFEAYLAFKNKLR